MCKGSIEERPSRCGGEKLREIHSRNIFSDDMQITNPDMMKNISAPTLSEKC